ncbi:MAG: peptidoglycan-binding protein LysM [Flavobacteriaceae bacterium]
MNNFVFIKFISNRYLFLYSIVLLLVTGLSENLDKSSVFYLVKEKPDLFSKSHTVPFIEKDFIGFREFLGFFESGSDYKKINRFGYLGKYQFGRGTLDIYGVSDLNDFIYNPELQEKVFLMNIKRNKWILRREIKNCSNKFLEDLFITESGILAAAHLSGPGNVKKFLRNKASTEFNKKDANGTSISDYIRIFKNYNLINIKQERRPKISL